MTDSHFCTHCGARCEPGAHFCKECGKNLEATSEPLVKGENTTPILPRSEKSARTALLLCLFLGPLGIHRFYVGKIGTGILMLLTAGGLGIWALVDLILIASCDFKDADGKQLEFTKGKGTTLKRVFSIIGLVLAAIIIYITALVAFVMYATSGIADTVQEQLSAFRSGDIEKAYSYTSKEFQDSTSLEAFKKSIDQIPALKNNESASFNQRQIENNNGMVKGTLKSKDGKITSVEFKLVREGETWKIIGIHVLPTIDGKQSENEENTSSQQSGPLVKEFTNNNNRYSVKYPDDWSHEQPDKATEIFGKKREGTSFYYSTISIQTIRTKRIGGNYSNIQDFIDAIKQQASKEFTDFKITNESDVELPQNPNQFKGKALIFTYKKGDLSIKQMLVILMQDDGKVFYTWGYTASKEQFEKDLPIAKRMFESWKIY